MFGVSFSQLQVRSSPCFWCLSPAAMLVQWVVLASWWMGLVPVFCWMWLDLVFLVGRSTFGGVFWFVCGLIMILGSLCANAWRFLPVLLVVWHRVSCTVPCSSLSGWVLTLRCRSLGDFQCLILRGAGRSLVDQCPELGSPTSVAQP